MSTHRDQCKENTKPNAMPPPACWLTSQSPGSVGACLSSLEIPNFPFCVLDNRVTGVKQVVLPSLLGLWTRVRSGSILSAVCQGCSGLAPADDLGFCWTMLVNQADRLLMNYSFWYCVKVSVKEDPFNIENSRSVWTMFACKRYSVVNRSYLVVVHFDGEFDMRYIH